jgi:hypothetical protein
MIPDRSTHLRLGNCTFLTPYGDQRSPVLAGFPWVAILARFSHATAVVPTHCRILGSIRKLGSSLRDPLPRPALRLDFGAGLHIPRQRRRAVVLDRENAGSAKARTANGFPKTLGVVPLSIGFLFSLGVDALASFYS